MVNAARKKVLPTSILLYNLVVPNASFADFLIANLIIPEQPTLGAGYFSIGENVVSKCIEVSPENIELVGGASDNLSISTFNSKSSFRKEMSLSGAATFGFGLFKGSLASNYIENASISRYETYAKISVSSTQSAKHLDTSKIKLVDALSPSISTQNFIRKCGDKFFTSVRTGGGFEAIIKFETSTDERQKSLESTLSVGGFLNGDVELKQRMSTVISENSAKYSITMTRSGVGGEFPQQDVSSLIDYALKFPVKVKDHSESNNVVSFSAMAYSSVFQHGDAKLENAARELDSLADAYEAVNKIKSSIIYVKAHPNEFSPRAQIKASDVVLVEDTIRAIKQEADRCRVEEKCDSSSVQIPKVRLPERISWSSIDVTNIGFQQVGVVPEGESRILEVSGIWNCSRNNPSCWLNAEDTVQYQIVAPDGGVVQSGETSKGTALLKFAGSVRVRVADGPGVSEFLDNTYNPSQPVRATVW